MTGDPTEWQRASGTTAPIVSMIVFQGRALVATTDGVYEIKDGELIPLEFVTIPSEQS